MTILKRLVATTGEYTAADGSTKKRYQNVGALHKGQYGPYETLDVASILGVAMTAAAKQEDRIFINLYDVEGDKQPAPQRQAPQQQAPFDDDIPF